MIFWDTPEWHRYEVLYGDEPGTRARLLASADWMTRVVDLSLSEAERWKGVRRSYHATINRLTREFIPWDPDGWMSDDVRAGERDVIDGEGAGWVTRTCELLHKADAGRQTRSDATWQLMGDWAEGGSGLFVVAFDFSQPTHEALAAANPLIVDGQPLDMGEPTPCVGFVYFVRHEDWAYYFTAASLRRDINIALVWWAMLALKVRGVHWCELGWQGEATDAKGQQIEFMKRGFGGVDIPAKEAPKLCGL